MNACTCTETSLCISCRDRAERDWERAGVMPPDPRHILNEMWADALTYESSREERVYGRRRRFEDYDQHTDQVERLAALRKRAQRDTEYHEVMDADVEEGYEECA